MADTEGYPEKRSQKFLCSEKGKENTGMHTTGTMYPKIVKDAKKRKKKENEKAQTTHDSSSNQPYC